MRVPEGEKAARLNEGSSIERKTGSSKLPLSSHQSFSSVLFAMRPAKEAGRGTFVIICAEVRDTKARTMAIALRKRMKETPELWMVDSATGFAAPLRPPLSALGTAQWYPHSLSVVNAV